MGRNFWARSIVIVCFHFIVFAGLLFSASIVDAQVVCEDRPVTIYVYANWVGDTSASVSISAAHPAKSVRKDLNGLINVTVSQASITNECGTWTNPITGASVGISNTFAYDLESGIYVGDVIPVGVLLSYAGASFAGNAYDGKISDAKGLKTTVATIAAELGNNTVKGFVSADCGPGALCEPFVVDVLKFPKADASLTLNALGILGLSGVSGAGSFLPSSGLSSTNSIVFYVAHPVPEPETYAMMLAGLGLLGVMTRRRKQAQA